MRKKIVDCFLFNDEIEMLNFRLHELSEYVDYFLILEGNRSFDGKEKKYFFEDNINRFEKFSNKIIYLKLNVPENLSRIQIFDLYNQALQLKILNLKLDFEDLISYSDIDEIPDFTKIEEIIELSKINPVTLVQKNFFWNKFYVSSINHYGTVILTFSHFLFEKDTFKKYKFNRGFSSSNEYINCGWHFSNFFSTDECFAKIKTTYGLKYNDSFYLDKNNIENLRKNLLPLVPLNPSSNFRLKEYAGELPKNHELLPNHDVGRNVPTKFTININDYKSKIDIPKTEYYSNEKTEKFGFEQVYFLNELKKELYKFYPIDKDVFLFSEMNKELFWKDIKNNFLSELLLN